MPHTLKKSKSKSKPKKLAAPGPQIVRAWFDTVINPLLKGLERENKLLLHFNWTWQFRTGALESIRPAKQYVPGAAQENLLQFLDFYPNAEKGIDQHDREVTALTTSCSKLQSTLVTQSPLPHIYEELTTPESLRLIGDQYRQPMGAVTIELAPAERVREYFGGYPASDHVALLAQYIVNNTGQLPDHFTTSPFWNRFRERLIAIRQSPQVARRYRETTGVGARLSKAAVGLSQTLQEARFQLSVKHDVPYVDPSSIQHSDWLY